jgi:hypothetical protein
MTPELEEYFDHLNVMFNSEGYKLLIEEVENKIALLNDLTTVKTADELHRRHGQIAALRSVLYFSDTVAVAREQAEEGEDAQDF